MTNKSIVILILAFCFGLNSCATSPTRSTVSFLSIGPTKPNVPYSGISHELDEISKKNSLLAVELRKLPDLQDGISPTETDTLKRLVEFYNNAPDTFDSAFEEMYREGLSEVRKYCSPLQALFWLLEDDKSDLAKESIENYELKWLLLPAWSSKREERWKDYDTVIERLNSPNLINVYQRSRLSYSTDRGNRPGRPRKLFRFEKGDCRDYTAFSVECLLKAGYRAMPIQVVNPSGRSAHVVCEYEENGKKYIMDNSCRYCGSGFGITEKEIYVKRHPQVGYGYLHNTY